jgi:DNA-binding transcriptional regulator YhcF (GntR family)
MNKRNILLIIVALFVVHDLAVKFECNHNTLLATCCILQQVGIIDNRNTDGPSVTESTVALIREKEKKEFIANDLPGLQRKIELLQLNEQDLSELLNLIKSNSK